MLSNKETNKTLFYFVYAMSIAIFMVSLMSANGAILIISSIILLSSVILLHSGHIINNILIKKSKIIEISGNYRLSQNLSSISKNENGLFKSISIALISPRQNSPIKGDSVRDLIDSLTEQFEFSIELLEVDKTKILENLKTKLRMKEIALSRADGSAYDKTNALRRQIDLINGDISSLVSVGKSFQFAIKLMSICVSESQSEAESSSSKNIEIIANKFSAALGIDHEILSGERLLFYSGV
ncbi:MAG: hypothetical protein ACYCO0_00220 [Candidatus Micrarchaeaceae archaeon]